MKNKGTLLLRWLVLLAILANIAYNGLYNTLDPSLATMKEVSERYQSLFTPASYAFSIWGIIYLSFIGYAIAQLLPDRRNKEVYSDLALPMIGLNIASSAWINLFGREQLGASVAVISAMLILAVYLFVVAGRAVMLGEARSWLLVPFSLFLGWIAVAVIANVSVWLEAKQWGRDILPEEGWTMLMIGVAALLSLLIAWRWKNFIVPLVVAWASYAISVARRPEYPSLGIVALAAAIVCVITALILLFRKRGLRTV
ncbi:MAG TPA: TspO/MBR family protein [Flavisolibacter sp.]|nr:TspO/MBR family protein [Flavisolibacter sp.]